MWAPVCVPVWLGVRLCESTCVCACVEVGGIWGGGVHMRRWDTSVARCMHDHAHAQHTGGRHCRGEGVEERVHGRHQPHQDERHKVLNRSLPGCRGRHGGHRHHQGAWGGGKGAWGHGWAGLLWACLHVACLRTEASGRRGAPKFAAALCSCSRHFLSVLNGLLQCVSRTEHRGAGSVNCACRCVHAYVHACACMAESVHVQVSVAMCIGWSC